MIVTGEPALAERVTSADLAHIAATVIVGRPWEGRATVAGEQRPVVAAAAAPEDPGALLVLVRADGAPPVDAGALAVLQGIWDVVALRAAQRIEDAEPTDLTASRVAASERTRVATELADAHGATLAGLLGRCAPQPRQTAPRAGTPRTSPPPRSWTCARPPSASACSATSPPATPSRACAASSTRSCTTARRAWSSPAPRPTARSRARLRKRRARSCAAPC